MQLQQELINTPSQSTPLNCNNDKLHPLVNPNHPGRIHRKIDKLPQGINRSKSEGQQNKSSKPQHAHKPHNIHPLSNPNHPGRVHRHTDKLPNGINQSESVKCKNNTARASNAHKNEHIHPLSNPNHPGRIHRNTERLPKVTVHSIPIKSNPNTKDNGNPMICKVQNAPVKITCRMPINHPSHPLSNPNHPGRIHRNTESLPKCVNELRTHPLCNPSHPGRIHRKNEHLPCIYKDQILTC